MKIEIQRTFEEYFQQFEESEEINVKIKRLILENIGLEEELHPILERFINIAKKHNYAYSIALGYSMVFYFLYCNDVDRAIAYNEKARALLKQIPGYENTEGILTVANNAVLGHILKEDYGAAYMEILRAMPMAEKSDRITYYSAFLNNGAIILAEFGLYEKAIQQVEETLQKRNLIGESNYIVTIFLYGNLCVSSGNIEKLRKVIKDYAHHMETTELFDTTMFHKFYVEAAIMEKDKVEATRAFHHLQDTYLFENNDIVDNAEIYLVYARYYMLMEDYEQAEKYYKLVLENVNNMLGHKRQIHEEIAILNARKRNYKDAYESLNKANDRSKRYVAFIDDMYRHELDDVWEKNRMLSYEVLYQRLLDITTFGKTVISSLTRNQLIDVIQTHLPQIFQYDICRLMLYDEKKQQFQSLDGTIFLSANLSFLKPCVVDKDAIIHSNIKSGDAICEQLDSLYYSSIRSILMQPVTYQNTLLAMIYFGSEQINFFSHADQGLLQVFADYVAIALHNIYQFEDAVEKSSYDYLTGTFNRSALMQRGEEMLLMAQANGDSIGVLMMDIDNFKNINDTYGHIKGDEVIRKVTAVMDVHKQHGMIARFGGEEFILLIDHITKHQLYQIAEAIRYDCENSQLNVSGSLIDFTISIGGCHHTNIHTSLKALFEEADQRLYIAKRNGKNCVQM